MRCRITLHRSSITPFRVLAEDVELHTYLVQQPLYKLYDITYDRDALNSVTAAIDGLSFVYVVPRPSREAYCLNRCLLLVTLARHSGTF
jgi:hypothetical protein